MFPTFRLPSSASFHLRHHHHHPPLHLLPAGWRHSNPIPNSASASTALTSSSSAAATPAAAAAAANVEASASASASESAYGFRVFPAAAASASASCHHYLSSLAQQPPPPPPQYVWDPPPPYSHPPPTGAAASSSSPSRPSAAAVAAAARQQQQQQQRASQSPAGNARVGSPLEIGIQYPSWKKQNIPISTHFSLVHLQQLQYRRQRSSRTSPARLPFPRAGRTGSSNRYSSNNSRVRLAPQSPASCLQPRPSCNGRQRARRI